MMNKGYKTHPEKIETNELILLKESMEVDPERFKEDLSEINLELTRRPDYSKQESTKEIQ